MRLSTLFFALIMTAFLAPPVAAQDGGGDFSQQDAKEMVFSKLPVEKQKTVVAMLKKIMDDSMDEAEKSIRENGSLMPFGYVVNSAGEGQFLRLGEDQKVSPEYAAHGIQKAIITNAYRGDLVASALYLAMGAPKGLGNDIREKLETSIKGDRSIEDVRFLMVELQHLGGLGMVMTVPYWRMEEQWHFGEPVQKRVSPELHNTVQKTFRRAAKKQGGEKQSGG